MDAYISPREILLGGAEMQEKVALIIQQFGADIVLPHLRCFTSRCEVESIPPVQMPHLCFFRHILLYLNGIAVAPGTKFCVEGSGYLPPFEASGDGFLRCHCVPTQSLAKDMVAHRIASMGGTRAIKVEDPDEKINKKSTVPASSGWPTSYSAFLTSMLTFLSFFHLIIVRCRPCST